MFAKYIAGPGNSLRAILLATLWLLAGPAMSATRVCGAPRYRQLDFWLGHWRVIDRDGKGPLIAQDRVTAILDGCAILERYRQDDGHGGDGFTMYDASRRVWHQTWMSNSGELLVLEGRCKRGTLIMRGSNLGKDGRREWYRATWRRQGAGVRETAYISRDGGKSWGLDFDILFLRRISAAGRSATAPRSR